VRCFNFNAFLPFGRGSHFDFGSCGFGKVQECLSCLKLAKHENMNERKLPLPQSASEIVRPPAFPTSGNQIFERIGTAVSASRGYNLENIDFARLIGRSESTTSHWFGVSSQPHLVSFFCLLEQLPPLERYRVVDSLCRVLPLFDHPRLQHNPVAATTMKNILPQTTGLTLLVGGTDEQRTFLITALGHTFRRIDRRHRNVAGIDLHDPSWFVPVETMLYLKGPSDPVHVGGLVRRIWPEILGTKKPIILLNGIWSALPEVRNDILSLAARRHVIVADQQITVPRVALQADHPVHSLSISTARENINWISVQVTRS